MSISKRNGFEGSEFGIRKYNSLTLRQMFITHIAILLTLFLWLYSDYQFININSGVDAKPRIFFVIPFNLFNLLIPIIVAYNLFGEYRQKLISSNTALILFLFVIYSVLGFANGSPYYKTDVLTAVAYFSGYAFMWLILKSKNPQYYFSLMMFLFSLFILLKSYIDQLYFNFGLDRYTSQFLYNYTLLLYFLTGINAVWAVVNKRRVYLILTLISWSIMFYCGVLLGATRSLAVSLGVVIIFSLLSSFFILKKNQLKNSLFMIVIVVISLLSFSYILYSIVEGTMFSSSSVISQRIEQNHTIDFRIEEATEVLNQLNIIDFFIGRGLGITIKTVLGQTHVPHIAILWFLMSFGVVPFLYIVYLLYIKTPSIYLKRLLSIKRKGIIHPILLVAPSLFAWSAALLISGGISYFSFFGIGITLCFYNNFRKSNLYLTE